MSEPSETLGPIREQRERLATAADELEEAVTSPAGNAIAWRIGVDTALKEMVAAVANHVELTEGPDGVYSDVVDRTPRLYKKVERLKHEHGDLQLRVATLESAITGEIDETIVEWIRGQAYELFLLVSRHRSKAADLIFESYDSDIGESE